jgi:hypothetical protein
VLTVTNCPLEATRARNNTAARKARDTNSPYVDNRPCLVATKPENRQYKAIYVQADGEIGQASDIVTLVCLP